MVYLKEIIELALARPMLGTIKVQRSRPRRPRDIGGGEPGRAACPCTARARLFLAKTPSVGRWKEPSAEAAGRGLCMGSRAPFFVYRTRTLFQDRTFLILLI